MLVNAIKLEVVYISIVTLVIIVHKCYFVR